jgi:hypothetical protein
VTHHVLLLLFAFAVSDAELLGRRQPSIVEATSVRFKLPIEEKTCHLLSHFLRLRVYYTAPILNRSSLILSITSFSFPRALPVTRPRHCDPFHLLVRSAPLLSINNGRVLGNAHASDSHARVRLAIAFSHHESAALTVSTALFETETRVLSFE